MLHEPKSIQQHLTSKLGNIILGVPSMLIDEEFRTDRRT